LARDTWGTDIVDELAPSEGESVVYKTRFSAFYRTELDELLASWGVKHLIITGCTTSICVESTIRDAFYRDYHCILLEDCAAEPMGRNLSRSNHEATVLLVERIFGSVSTSTNFVHAVEAPPVASRCGVAQPLPQVPAAAVFAAGGPGARHDRAAKRGARRPCQPCVSVLRAPGYGQDDHCAHPRPRAQLFAAPGRRRAV